MSAIARKIFPLIVLLCLAAGVFAQQKRYFISGHFTEKSWAELQLLPAGSKPVRPIAEFKIDAKCPDFAFPIPADTGATYRLKVSFMKQEGRHPKAEKTFTLPLSVSSGHNYTLLITPSRLDTVKKQGWQLRKNDNLSNVALVTGSIVQTVLKSAMSVVLEGVENGEPVFRNSVLTNSNADFEIAYPVKQEGFYYLSTPHCRTRIYLKPADRLHLVIDHKTGKTVSLEGSEENKTLFAWQQLIAPITEYGYNLSVVNADALDINSYIDKYKKLQPAMDQFPGGVSKSNPVFIKAFNDAMQVDRQLAPLDFLSHQSAKKTFGYASDQKDWNDVPGFFNQFGQPGAIGNASILIVGEARRLMLLYSRLGVNLARKDGEKLTDAERLRRMMNMISNDTLKALFLNDQLQKIEVNNLSEFKETFEPFRKYAKTSPVKEIYQNVYSQFAADTAFIGKSSYDFSLPDTSGKLVSMKDFRGKVVFVDVWATWCGPCRAQFPFLKEIEEEYARNKDLVFVGVSLDKIELRDRWLDMIRKEKLGGIQLQDDFGKAFGRKYALTAIPRFMLIDRQGRWIEIRCPRPEAKEDLKRYLDRALREG